MNSDERLQRHVLDELDWEPSVDASKIGVAVTDGIVIPSGNSRNVSVETEHRKAVLTGDVHSQSEFDEAERVALSARGLNEVENCLTITPWGSGPCEEWGY